AAAAVRDEPGNGNAYPRVVPPPSPTPSRTAQVSAAAGTTRNPTIPPASRRPVKTVSQVCRRVRLAAIPTTSAAGIAAMLTTASTAPAAAGSRPVSSTSMVGNQADTA